MAIGIKKVLLRTFKILGITIGSIVALVFLIPYLFPQAVNGKIQQWANNNIDGKISFTKTRLSFFKHFPSLTLTMYDISLLGSAPFEKDTLIAAKEISFGIDLSSVMKSKITVNKIFLNEAFINIQADSAGHANYNIYKSNPQAATTPADTNGASLGINKILIENSRLVYNDQSLPMTVNARGFNYTGSGDLSKDVFDLKSHTKIESLDFYYAKQPYIIGKSVNADLVTQINTRSLTFIFEKNDLNINQLPVQFNGRFGFIKNGYEMDFDINSHENDLNEIISALPEEYQKLVAETEIKGTGNVQVALKGKYVAADSVSPDLSLVVQVRDGFISNRKSPAPIQNLYLNLETRLPGLNADSLTVNIDSMHFNLGAGYFNAAFRVKGVKEPDLFARVNAELDLHKWDSALGLKPFHVKGMYKLRLLAEGRYATAIRPAGRRHKQDTVITSIPKFSLVSSFRDGYFKYTSLPEAIRDISFDMSAGCPDNDYKHISFSMDHLNAVALNDYLKGYFKVGNLDNFPVDAELKAKFHLEDLKKFYPIDSLELKGDLNADIVAKGTYLPDKKKYPAVDASITLDNGYILTRYYPHPIENLQVNTTITDKTGSLAGIKLVIKPLSFEFEKEPFALKAELTDFTNIAYKMNIKGNLNLDNIYKVFAVKGYNVTGSIAANVTLKGKQSDATAGRYDLLANKGTLKVNQVQFTMDMYPKPFVISRGVFSFNQDKMRFDTFKMTYANSVFILNGALSNVLDYAVKPGAVLKGSFDLKSSQIVVNDFMVADTSKPVATSAAAPSTGVVMVPKNLDLDFTADVKKVKYSDLVIKDARGHMSISNGTIVLKQTGFNLVDAIITMDATYTGLSPQKATFDYHISANDFDIQKAYKGIKLFRDMATSAKSAEGLISLDYKLSGKLNSAMAPIYPSLKGGGVVTAKKIKMHGFKLFNAIAEKTNKDSVGGNPDVSKVELKSTIANNIITIETTKIRLAGFRAKFGGQVSFDKSINLKFRLGLPPMGIIGIPMTITGTQDKPDIHLGKGSDDDDLKEVKDDGED